MKQCRDSSSVLQSSSPRKDHKSMLLIILSGCLLLLGFTRDMYTETSESAGAELHLFWDGTHGGLIATGERPSSSESSEPASISPLLFKKIPVNSAGVELLDTIPGIGPRLAGRIVDERGENGYFISANDLLRVSGIGVKRKQQLRAYLRFD